MKSYLNMFIIFFALAIAGCSAVGQMPPEMDMKAKEMGPLEGKALVYILRPATFGTAIKMEVTCDGINIGSTGGGRYIYSILEPGSHVFISKAENKSELPIILEAGKVYYLEQKVKMWILKARNNLERLDDQEGRDKLLKCKLSNDIKEK